MSEIWQVWSLPLMTVLVSAGGIFFAWASSRAFDRKYAHPASHEVKMAASTPKDDAVSLASALRQPRSQKISGISPLKGIDHELQSAMRQLREAENELAHMSLRSETTPLVTVLIHQQLLKQVKTALAGPSVTIGDNIAVETALLDWLKQRSQEEPDLFAGELFRSPSA
jgi:hypothetical protein